MNIDGIRSEIRELNLNQRNAILRIGGDPEAPEVASGSTFISLVNRGLAEFHFTWAGKGTRRLTRRGRAAYAILKEKEEKSNG